MICVVALVVFAVLAIFSAKYRPLAKEAFDCSFRKLTFRKCKTNLDQRIRAKLTGKLMRTPRIARFTYNNFQILSVIFTILFFVSLIYTGYGVYNVIIYGNCNGPDDEGFCIFEPLSVGGCAPEECTNVDCNCGAGETCDCETGTCK